jgi:hypothetical protein
MEVRDAMEVRGSSFRYLFRHQSPVSSRVAYEVCCNLRIIHVGETRTRITLAARNRVMLMRADVRAWCR